MHDTLVMRDNSLKLVPGLATSWQQVNATTWRFTLRQGVKFHDGSPFTADDVVFTWERASHPNSQLRQYAIPVGKPRKIDDYTVEFVQDKPNPVTLEHATTIYIMSKAWATKNKVERPLDFKGKEETPASRSANGTGPWILVSREPGVRTVLKRNNDWWGIKEGRAPGNVTEVIYTQVSADATRTAALLSGQVDFVLDPPPQDMRRLEENKAVKVARGQENRVVFFGFDQSRDELLYSSVKGKNPFKDVRVRTAVYQAIDIEAIRSRIMRNAALPTGGITPSILASNPDAEKRLPFDPARAKQLLTEAGYPNGFDVTLDCPNNRYINDEEICLAVAAMLAKIGIQTRVDDHAARDVLPEAREVRHQHVHARLGRRDHRRADDAVAGAALARSQDRQRLVQLRSLRQSEARRADRRGRRRTQHRETARDHPAGDRRAQRAGAPRAAAPADDPVGDAQQRHRRASRRQRAQHGVDHDRLTAAAAHRTLP